MSAPAAAVRVIGEFEFDPACKIGAGSFATVYSGRRVSDDMPIAIKAVEVRKLNKKLTANLQLEIQILMEHSHDNIVKLHAVEKPANDVQHVYLVMEFCQGGDLAGFLKKRGGHVPESTARGFMRHIATGMAYLQEHNLIHRDLKPHNLLLSKDSASALVKIADFGFARMIKQDTMADTMCGSPLYMAPEVLSSQKYDLKADLWSSGTILFQMICGKPPYHGDNYIHLLENIKKKAWALPEACASKTSQDCKDLLTAMLQKAPKNRIEAANLLAHPFFQDMEAAPAEAALQAKPAEPAPQVKPENSSAAVPAKVPAIDTRTRPGARSPKRQELQLTPTNGERNQSLGDLDDYVLVASPPPGPFKRGGLVLQKMNSGENVMMMDSIDRMVSNLMSKPAAGEDPAEQEAVGINASHSQATIVMEIANAMVQHNPRDALALYVKVLNLLKKTIINASAHPQHVVEAKELFVTVCDKAEALTAGVPLYAENGQSAEEILYECALAMGREAASFELLTDSQTARKHYGIAFACLHLLRAESTSEADHTVLDRYLKLVEMRAKELWSQEAAAERDAQASDRGF